ncbi:MAG: 50S ribosomal protein L13 [Firmicutes bacterium]|nr:50S ribosomal protein L13 [Bacillota bacterium]
MPKSSSIKRSSYVVDASGLPLGRLSAQVASILRGKTKPIFSPHVDCGDFVSVINCDKVVLTGKKLTSKRKYKYTGYVGNLKTLKYSDLMSSKPDKAVRVSIKGMLPATSLSRRQIRRLTLYLGDVIKEDKSFKKWTYFRKIKVR